MTSKIGPDFVLAQLTGAGHTLAKNTPLRVANGRISITFPASGAPVKVARYEWDLLLKEHAPLGERLFEIVLPNADPDSKPAAPAAPTVSAAPIEAPKEKV